jgi:hypothetical protein
MEPRVQGTPARTLTLISIEGVHSVIAIEQQRDLLRFESGAKGFAVQPTVNHSWKGHNGTGLIQGEGPGREIQPGQM